MLNHFLHLLVITRKEAKTEKTAVEATTRAILIRAWIKNPRFDATFVHIASLFHANHEVTANPVTDPNVSTMFLSTCIPIFSSSRRIFSW